MIQGRPRFLDVCKSYSLEYKTLLKHFTKDSVTHISKWLHILDQLDQNRLAFHDNKEMNRYWAVLAYATIWTDAQALFHRMFLKMQKANPRLALTNHPSILSEVIWSFRAAFRRGYEGWKIGKLNVTKWLGVQFQGASRAITDVKVGLPASNYDLKISRTKIVSLGHVLKLTQALCGGSL